jgi:hypothetical protein
MPFAPPPVNRWQAGWGTNPSCKVERYEESARERFLSAKDLPGACDH